MLKQNQQTPEAKTMKLYVGIDPGESNGVALYDKARGLRLHTLGFWQLISFINGMIYNCRESSFTPVFVVEDPNLNTFIYEQKVRGYGKDLSMKIAQNVGMNKLDAKRIIQYLEEECGISVERVRPNSRSPKWSQEFFNSLVGKKMTCSQHARDAAKLISQYWVK